MKKRIIIVGLCLFCVSGLSLMAQEDWVSVPAAAFKHGQSPYPFELWGGGDGWRVQMGSSAWGSVTAPVHFYNATGKRVKSMTVVFGDTSTTSTVSVTLFKIDERDGTATSVFNVSSGEANTYVGRATVTDFSGTKRVISNRSFSWWIMAHFSGSPLEEDKVSLFWVKIKYE